MSYKDKAKELLEEIGLSENQYEHSVIEYVAAALELEYERGSRDGVAEARKTVKKQMARL